MTQFAIKCAFSFSPHPMSASALPRESRPSEICDKIYKKVKKTSPILLIIAWKKI